MRKVKREMMEMKEEYWRIIAKHHAKEELSEDEKKSFDQLSTYDEIKKISLQTEDIFKKTDLFFTLHKFDTEKAWKNVDVKMNPKRTKILNVSWAYIAAAIFLLLVTTSVFIWKMGINNQESHEFATNQFDFSNPIVELPDGSKVLLNYGSRLIYPEEFKGNEREVLLTGEAFFEVAPNPEKPFIIKSNGASIRVLGTSFNVYAYKESATIEVIVKTGKVELFNISSPEKSKGGKVLLLPGEKGTYNKKIGTIGKETSYNPNNLSWLTHNVEFTYTPLCDVFQTLQRIFNISITVENEVDLKQPLCATFYQQKPDYIMNVVAMTMNLNIKKENNQYIIQNKNQ